MMSRSIAIAMVLGALATGCETHKAEPPPRGQPKSGDTPAGGEPAAPAAGGTPTAAQPANPAAGEQPPPAAGAEPDCNAVAQRLLTLLTRQVAAAPPAERKQREQEIGQKVAAQKAHCLNNSWPADYKRCLIAATDEASLSRCDSMRPEAPVAAPTGPAPSCEALAVKLFKQQRDYVAATLNDPKTPEAQRKGIEAQLKDMDANRAQGIQSLGQQCNQLAWTPALRNCLDQAKDGKEIRMCMTTLFKPPAAPPGGEHGPDDGHGH